MTDVARSGFAVPRTAQWRGTMSDDFPPPRPQSPGGGYAVNVLPPARNGYPSARASQTAELTTLLFGLSLAIVLPSESVVAPRDSSEPAIEVEPLAVVGAQAVSSVLGRTTVAVGSGHVILDQVDRRMGGLMAWINAYRLPDPPSALVSTGLVTDIDDLPPSIGFRVTPRGLWELAKELHTQGGQNFEQVRGLGEDAFLAMRGAHTAQVAWLNGERLASVAVTSLQAEQRWVIASARALAERAGKQ
jgi:hypothetical protein